MQRKLGRKIRGWAFGLALLAAGPAARRRTRRSPRRSPIIQTWSSRRPMPIPARPGRKAIACAAGAGPFRRGAGAYLWRTAAAYGRAGPGAGGGGFCRAAAGFLRSQAAHGVLPAARGAHATGVQGCFRRHAASGLAQGGRSGAHLSGRHVVGQFRRQRRGQSANRQAVGSERRFRRRSWYGSCAYVPKNAPTLQLLHPIRTARIVLLARDDKETPIAPCFPCWTT